MRDAWIVSALVASACGGGARGDDCERFFEKVKPVFATQGKQPSAEDKAKLVDKCRADLKAGKVDASQQKLMKCVLDATGDAAVAACLQPAFSDYMARAKTSEAKLQLNKLGKLAKIAFAETAAFPVGSAPATPAAPCCGGPEGKCAAVPYAEWQQHAAWKALDFAVEEPARFQYSYESRDGKTFVAQAVGDLDCDGTTITYRLEGSVVDGSPQTTLIEPASAD